MKQTGQNAKCTLMKMNGDVYTLCAHEVVKGYEDIVYIKMV